MKYRTWDEIIELSKKISSPMAVNRIRSRLGIGTEQFKRLVEQGFLEFVDNKRQELRGRIPIRYVSKTYGGSWK